jgi:hypothetical protein
MIFLNQAISLFFGNVPARTSNTMFENADIYLKILWSDFLKVELSVSAA